MEEPIKAQALRDLACKASPDADYRRLLWAGKGDKVVMSNHEFPDGELVPLRLAFDAGMAAGLRRAADLLEDKY